MFKRSILLIPALFGLVALAGCSGNTSGGVGTSTSAAYSGTISYSGYNTCGVRIPGRGQVKIVIRSNGTFVFDPVGMAWAGGRYGSVALGGAVSGSKIQGTYPDDGDGYNYRVDGRINDNGGSISGTGYIEGRYGRCYEKFQGTFAATRVG
jgi:predicted small secreted protein